MSREQRFKILLIGDSKVGKTSLLELYKSKKVNPSPIPTIGCDYSTVLRKHDNQDVRLVLWDTTGQEKYWALSRSYYRDAHGFLVVFSIEDRSSFDNVKYWIEEVRTNSGRDVPFLLVGNKVDLHEKREVSIEEAFRMKNELNVQYFETSIFLQKLPPHGRTIEEIFYELCSELLSKGGNVEEQVNGKEIVLQNTAPQKNWCCN